MPPSHLETALRLAVLNPGGRDPEQLFPDGAGPVDESVHAPVNYHAYAASTRGGFFRDPAAIPEDFRHVLLLLRRDIGASSKALDFLLKSQRVVAISFKEAGVHQLPDVLDSARALRWFRELSSRAGAAVASSPDLVSLYRSAGAARTVFIPTPYPLEDPRWDFSIPAAEREGLFIGTREFHVPSRNHLGALFAAREICARRRVRVTVLNPDGRDGRRRLEAIGFDDGCLHIVDGRLPYAEYLRLMASHRLVFQADRSGVPGQVAGDALLCRLPCVGGDGAIERIAFARTCGHGRDTGELLKLAERLLEDETFYQTTIEGSQSTAVAALSFKAGAAHLTRFFGA